MAKSPTQMVEEQQAKELLQDMRETRAAQDEAADKTLPSEQIPNAPVKPTEEAVEDDPELLAKLQDPHGFQRGGDVKTAVFTNAYGGKVRAAV